MGGQNQPNRGIASISTGGSGNCNIPNSTNRPVQIQVMPSSNGGSIGIPSKPYNSSHTHSVGATGNPQLYFSNTSTPPLQGYVVQLQSSGESVPIPVFVPPVTTMRLNNAATTSNMSQQPNVVTNPRQQYQQQGGSVRLSGSSGAVPQGEHVKVPTTGTSHLLNSQNQGSRQDSEQLISQLAIIQAYTPQGQVRPGSQTRPYQTGFNPHVLHQANNPTTQLNSQQLVRFQLYNVGQLLRAHSHQVRPENLRTMPTQGTVNRIHSTASFSDQQRNTVRHPEGSFYGVANRFTGSYKTNELSSLNQQIQNQQMLHSNSFANAQALQSSSQQNLYSITSGVGIQQMNPGNNQRIMRPQTPSVIRRITNDQHQISPVMINSMNARSSNQPIISAMKILPSQQLNAVGGPVNFHQQVASQKRMQRIINIQRTPDGIRLQTLNSGMQPLMKVGTTHDPNVQPKQLNLPPTAPTSNSGTQMGVYSTSLQQVFSQVPSLPNNRAPVEFARQVQNLNNQTCQQLQLPSSAYTRSQIQPQVYNSNPTAAALPNQQLASSLLNQSQTSQYDCNSPPSNANLQDTVSQLPSPEVIDISSPISKCCKSAAEELVQQSVPAATFYKPCIFRKTLPVGSSNKPQHATKTKTRERKQLVTASGPTTLDLPKKEKSNTDLPKKAKSVRQRKQPLKIPKADAGATPNKIVRPITPIVSPNNLPQTPPSIASTSTTVAAEKKKPNAKKSRKGVVGPSPKHVPATDTNDSSESLVNLTTPKSRKRSAKSLNHDVIIVRESNQLSIKKNVSTTCAAPNPKRRKKAPSDAVTSEDSSNADWNTSFDQAVNRLILAVLGKL
ncbi:hypothetical protein Ocin01_07473 [Orchesella cincta]|uniref:Uncharacterized protein n=1 Tax=Orchesella cincta TaxID=48709 RepID=A0A1D2N1R1_ORCCI|nr:hypothetical protein Ocin01_07473 [Orchesella cincta]